MPGLLWRWRIGGGFGRERVRDRRVLDAMERVPRHEFVPEAERSRAYRDRSIWIEEGVTTSQPYVIARMLELAALTPNSRALEIGTGSGYLTALLAEIAGEVYSIELNPNLARIAEARLSRLGYRGLNLRRGDGYKGWPERAPFDAILVTAAPPAVPGALKAQLGVGGRMVIPVGPEGAQKLLLITRSGEGFSEREVMPICFLPMLPEEAGNRE
jgi:protein-L-isoaspartate(D-aspartate) O-methyltransferase